MAIHAGNISHLLNHLDGAGVAACITTGEYIEKANQSLRVLLQAASESDLVGARIGDFLPVSIAEDSDNKKGSHHRVADRWFLPASNEATYMEIEVVPIDGSQRREHLVVIKHPPIDLPRAETIFKDETCGNPSSTYDANIAMSDTAAGIEDLIQWVSQRTDVNLKAYKRTGILRRLERHLVRNRCKNCREYLDLLKRDSEEERRFLENFTVTYTELFRDPELFKYLEDYALPEIVNHAKREIRSKTAKTTNELLPDTGRCDIRIWSAGTSSGEEAYSIAAIAQAACTGTDLLPIIFATDISESKLLVARRGLYSVEKYARIPLPLRHRYFHLVSERNFCISRDLRRRCIFGRHNLIADSPYAKMDLILCRNVMLYFTSDKQERLMRNLVWSLRPGGYLVLESSGSLPGSVADKLDGVAKGLPIFRKKESGD